MSKEIEEIVLGVVDWAESGRSKYGRPDGVLTPKEATQKIESLIKEQKLQLLKEVEECVPKEQEQLLPGTAKDYEEAKDRFYRAGGFNFCRTQIIKSIKELGEEL